VYKGRPTTLKAEVVASVVERRQAGEKPSELAREFGISRMTLHRYRTEAVGVEG
jgi:DNA invertase Pin-like site-specific DNA recombinase